MKNKRVIGLLGGIGPESSALFYREFVREFRNNKKPNSNIEFPHIIINSVPAPELFREKALPEQLEEYRKGVLDLVNWGADIIVIICNTANVYRDYFQKKISIPIIDPGALFKNYVKENKIRKYCILGTKITTTGDLYKSNDCEIISVSNEEQEKITEVINLFNLGDSKKKLKRDLDVIVNEKISVGAEIVVLGCTEVAAICRGEGKTLDPMDLIISELINYF